MLFVISGREIVCPVKKYGSENVSPNKLIGMKNCPGCQKKSERLSRNGFVRINARFGCELQTIATCF